MSAYFFAVATATTPWCADAVKAVEFLAGKLANGNS